VAAVVGLGPHMQPYGCSRPGNGDGDDEVAQEAGLSHVHLDQKMR
jgi:hypothetical protein